jgi:hypothetical protein
MPARRPAAACGALLIALAVPAAADAATFTTPLKPCYVTAGTQAKPQTEGFAVAASGFGVNSTVALAIDGAPVANGGALQADAAGNLVLPNPVPAPWIKAGQRDFTVTLTDNAVPGVVATATAKVTALAVDVHPRVAKPSDKVHFTGSGFTADAPVFAHYVRGRKLIKTVRMTRTPGVCGTWSAHRKQIPVRKAKTGLWTVQFDQAKRYRNGRTGGVKGVYVRLGINVRLVRG